jgi:hypothetical protein
MNYEDTLIAMLAPQEIIDCAKRLDANQYRGMLDCPASTFRKLDEDALTKWYNQAVGQNRYGQ